MHDTPPQANLSEQPGKAPPSAVGLTCDIANVDAYSPNFERPHLPVLAAFGNRPLHAYKMRSACDLKRAVSEKSPALVRSVRRNVTRGQEAGGKWDDLTFQFGPQAFLHACDSEIRGYASSPEEAERLVTDFEQTYRKPPSEPRGGSFRLIKYGGPRDVDCVTVDLPADSILDEETFLLHYGETGWAWHQQFTARLRTVRHGLSILEGLPGTGKTSYLRHLMGVLAGSHRFYFIPAAAMGLLSQPAFMGFWADQRNLYRGKNFVVILEDSDAALRCRGSDNREQVNAILNLSDGMLADFLRLQIICTINCNTTDIDDALLRPGRLLCHRVFGRLDQACAARLAGKLGHVLTTAPDYSLAEIYAGHGTHALDRPRIGFTP